MSASRQPRLTPEEYLEIERRAEFRNEYYNGQMYAMSGGSYRHALIIANLIHRLADALENPTFLAEVLSPSTEAYDRGFKSSQYRKIESLQEYALVSQDDPHVEV